MNLKRRGHLAVAEDLDREFETADRAALVQRLRRDRSVDLELHQALQIDDLPAGLVDVGEPAFVGHPLLKRKLSALESGSHTRSGRCFLAFGSAAGSLAVPASRPAADPLLLRFRALVRAQIVEIEWHRFVSIRVAAVITGRPSLLGALDIQE